ncbi:hypothetical protein A5740_03100, partial [Mycobacterium sp. GA-1841]|uniref:HNH endonuclease signature motif containing protein n=1 Tax=Mycobacterium sp. GA-1841 TaxID=1834154 RepID=UPI00096F8F46
MFDSDSDAALIDAMSAAARAESSAIAHRLAAIGELDTRREHELAETVYWRTDPFEAVAAEISAALNISRHRAGEQIRQARVLRDRLPHVAALFAAGDIDMRMVLAIINRTDTVDPSAWAAVDQALASRAASWMRLSKPKLRDRIDQWVARLDPHGERVPPQVDEGRHFTVEAGTIPGMAMVWGHLRVGDAAAIDQRLDALAATVCPDDPRTLDQRRADAAGALARLQDHLPCLCRSQDCPAAGTRAAADAAVLHVLADQATLDADSSTPGYLPGYGILPAQSVRDLAAHATRKPVRVPGDTQTREDDTSASEASGTADTSAAPSDTHETTESAAARDTRGATKRAATTATDTTDTADVTGAAPTTTAKPTTAKPTTTKTPAGAAGYRPSAALREFITWRDLTCRFPGCDRPAQYCDIDHTVPYPTGHTHPSNTKLYCRTHHLVKTFCPGWNDHQTPEGTIVFNTPTGHTYSTEAHGATLFTALATPTEDLNL